MTTAFTAGYHTVQTKSRLSVLGMGKVKKVQPLSEQAAIELGVELINDIVLIVCGLAIYLFIESRPSKPKEDDSIKPEDIEKLKNTLLVQKLELERQAAKISRLERIIVITAGTSRFSSQTLMDGAAKDTEIDRKCTITKDEIIIEDTVK